MKAAAAVLFAVGVSLFSIHVLEKVLRTRIQNNDFIYFNLATQLPVFVLGIAFHHVTRAGRWPLESQKINIMAFCVASGLTVVMFRYAGHHRWLYSLLSAASGVSFLFLFQFLRNDRRINNSWVRAIGRASYSMYLLHFLFAQELTSVIAPWLERKMPASTALALCYGGSVAATYGVARVSVVWIENPCIHLGQRLIAKMFPAQSPVNLT